MRVEIQRKNTYYYSFVQQDTLTVDSEDSFLYTIQPDILGNFSTVSIIRLRVSINYTTPVLIAIKGLNEACTSLYVYNHARV